MKQVSSCSDYGGGNNGGGSSTDRGISEVPTAIKVAITPAPLPPPLLPPTASVAVTLVFV